MGKKIYRAGVVGLSGIGMRRVSTGLTGALSTPMPVSHVGAYNMLPNTQLVAVCDLKQELFDGFRDAWGKDLPKTTAYSDFRKMIDAENLDILSVCTSDNAHTELVIHAANAGVKGIICEKPLATSVDECNRIIEACESNGTLMSVDHTRRWQPAYHGAQQVISEGMIGKVLRVTGVMGSPRAMLFRNGTHLIDGVCFFAGSDPQWVFAELEEGFDDCSSYCGEGGKNPDLDPACSGYVHFKNGVRAHINITKGQGSVNYIQVMGETGEMDIYTDSVTLRKGRNEAELLVLPSHRLFGISGIVHELIRAMEENGELISPPGEAKKVVEIIVGFLQSHTRGNIRVDLPLPPGH